MSELTITPDLAVKMERRELFVAFLALESETDEAIRFCLTVEWYKKVKAHLDHYEKFYA
ncbi:hypothetical protein [Aliikangiella coralliicola]|uniref:hypothetical protein n=1 Tax=Aliikangiella coralliicola TaxID=2592383 RepID=UPI00143E0B21|nr:hypothetical protein [Aliikangiella coralliicola]